MTENMNNNYIGKIDAEWVDFAVEKGRMWK